MAVEPGKFESWVQTRCDLMELNLIIESGRIKNFLRVVQTGSGAHPASYLLGTGAFFPWCKTAGT
jgi:hypothetical protein